MKREPIPQGPFGTLVVLGESTVEGGGWLSQTSERWADILWHLLETSQEQPLQYYNAGVGASVISPKSPGYAASNKPCASERLEPAVIARQPDLVVIAYGLNDMRAGMDILEFKDELRKIIERIRAMLNPLIVVVNVYHMSAYQYYSPFNKGSMDATRQYNQMLAELAAETGCAYADVWSAQGCKDYVVHPDTVHANKIGNLLIAHKVFETIIHHAPGMVMNINQRDAQTEWTRRCLEIQASG